MKKCIVIGGNGFMGKHIVQELLQYDRSVTVLDINEPRMPVAGVRYVNTTNLSDEEIFDIILANNEIIDLAYSTNPKTSYDDPLKDIVDNLQSTVRIFGLAAKHPSLTKFLYVSSGGAVYGNTGSKLINEQHRTNPISPYGITKLSIEKYGFMFQHNLGLPFVVIRPSNAYGPGQLPNRGQGFITQAIFNILNGIPVEVFGKSGTVRDYIYITDLAKGVVAALDAGEVGEIYNIGTQKGFSNLEVLDHLKKLHGEKGNKMVVKNHQKRKFDVNRNVLNCKKILAQCKWQASIDLEEGLELTWNHFLNGQ